MDSQVSTLIPDVNTIPNTVQNNSPNITPNNDPPVPKNIAPASKNDTSAPNKDTVIIQDDIDPTQLKSPKKEVNDEAHTAKRKPTRISDVWDHFTRITGGNPLDPRCTCNYRGANYACHTRRIGTSSLWVHFHKCKKNPYRAAAKTDKKQKDVGAGSVPKAAAFKETRRRRLLENYLQQQQMETTESKNDVDKYLNEEPLNPMASSFDILLWWKDNSSRFATLSLIARDVLAVPVSTVASKSAFSTSGRILDPFRSSLSPKMLEVLVCTQSWLKGRNDGMKSKDFLDDIHSYAFLEEGYIDKGKDTTAGASIDIIDE